MLEDNIVQRIKGVWGLISWKTISEDGETEYPFGHDAIGRLMYTEDYHVSVSIMTSKRELFSADDIAGGNEIELATAASTYLTYCGTYEIVEDQVVHTITMSLFPNWLHTKQVRYFEFVDDCLVLRTPLIKAAGVMKVFELKWKRI